MSDAENIRERESERQSEREREREVVVVVVAVVACPVEHCQQESVYYDVTELRDILQGGDNERAASG